MKQYLISGFFLATTLAAFYGTAAVAQSFYPVITPSAYYLVPGSAFTVAGARFAPGEKVVLAAFGNEPREIRADEQGAFNVTGLTVPFGVKNLSVSALGATSQAAIKRTLTVGNFYPVIKASRYSNIPGGTVEFTGTGFAPGEQVRILVNGRDSGRITASNGEFRKYFILPYSISDLRYEFEGELSGASAGQTIKVATLAKPWLKLSSYYPKAGSHLTVTGRGFGAGEEVAFSLDGGALGSATADHKGQFTFGLTVPAASGKKLIAAKGLLTGVSASEKFTKRGD